MADQPAPDTSRRDVLRYGLAATAVTAWAAPTVMTFRPRPASAGSEPPRTDDGPADVAASGPTEAARPSGELASTGSNLAWVALAGNTAIAVGGAAALQSRSQQRTATASDGSDAGTPGADDLPPSHRES